MPRLSFLCIVFLLLCSSQAGTAQRPLEAGVYVGATNYLGDLAESVSLLEVHPGYGAFIRWPLLPKLALKSTALLGRLSGDDRNSPRLGERSFRFSAPYWSLNLQLELFPFAQRNYISPIKFEPGVQPFLHVGIGFTHLDARLDASQSPDIAIKVPFPEPGDRSAFFNTSFGAGLRLDLWEYWSLSFDGSWWYVYSDLLDGVSLNGRPDRNDWYLTAGISVSHHFGGRTLCPSF